ncbi:MAG: hypothetical protein KC502_13395 [Myxococcales bacterium]|nr:hypothetical protein [Myxococcales bacterium]
MKTKLTALILAGSFLFSGTAFAGTKYYVYKKKGTNKCEITTRDQAKFKRAKGSSWQFVGVDSTRSGAKKIAKGAGCK